MDRLERILKELFHYQYSYAYPYLIEYILLDDYYNVKLLFKISCICNIFNFLIVVD